MDEFGSLKELDQKVLERIFQILGTGGIRYRDCQLVTKISGLRLAEDGVLEAENFWANDAEVNRYHVALVTRTRPNGTTYRDVMIIEHGNGDKIGDVVIEVRLNTNTGRYMVHTQMEQAFTDDTHFEMRPRAKRSSVQNPRQAINRHAPVDMPGGINSNPGRIAGLRIAQHAIDLRWADNLPEGEFMDISEYVDTYDSMGQSTLLKALKHCPRALSRDLYKQIVDPTAVKLPRKSTKK